MTVLANAWLIAFLVSAVFALLDGVFASSPAGPVLAGLRGSSFGAVVLGSPIIYAALITTRLPKGIFLPLLLFVPFSTLGGMPLPLWIPFSRLTLALSLVQISLFLVAIVRVQQRGGSLLLTHSEDPGPLVTRRSAVEFVAVCVVAVPLALLLYVSGSLSMALDHFTGGFVRLEGEGLVAEERRYERGDRTVYLIPMVHVAEGSFYRDVLSSVPVEDSIILAEGMSDESGSLSGDLSYRGVARALGLQAQEDALEPADAHYVENADLDISALSPETIDLIDAAALFLVAEDPEQRAEAWARVNARVREPGMVERAADEVIGMRNRHLLGRIDASLEEFRHVVVPWGAAHMPQLERGVLARGFSLSGRESRTVVRLAPGPADDADPPPGMQP
ncbi:MAG: hypothetical protein JRG82_07630 [Deltaproteobacteria bacterium]|nr:hypothetical protein [Deltaproteobacteria bacterium]